MGAKQNEMCGHCGSVIQTGYTACASCGATRKERRSILVWLASFIVFGLVSSIPGVLFEAGALPEVLAFVILNAAFIASVIAAVIVFRRFPKRVTYLRRVGG